VTWQHNSSYVTSSQGKKLVNKNVTKRPTFLCKFIKPAQALTYAPKQTQFFKLASIRRCADHEGGIVVKAAICTDYMQVEMKLPAAELRGIKGV